MLSQQSEQRPRDQYDRVLRSVVVVDTAVNHAVSYHTYCLDVEVIQLSTSVATFIAAAALTVPNSLY